MTTKGKLHSIMILLALMLPNLLYAASPAKIYAPLPASEAFAFHAHANAHNLVLQWHIAPQYYLYRYRFKLIRLSPEASSTPLTLAYPQAQTKMIAGVPYAVYEGKLTLHYPFSPKERFHTKKNTPLYWRLQAQGCSASGFCYPMIYYNLHLNPDNHKVHVAIQDLNTEQAPPQDRATQLLSTHQWWSIVLGFLGFGLLLSFTPCVLPMLPILSIIIAGQKHRHTAKAFWLSLTYVLSMSLTYATIGLLVALVGKNLQTTLQKPWIIIAFSLFFVFLGLSLLGVLPAHHLRARASRIWERIPIPQSGYFVSVALMGVLATLVLSPCVTPPLVGALVYIAHTGDLVLGSTALFTLGFGMGIPLLLMGTAGGAWLPKTGPWMQKINKLLGILMLMMALWLLARTTPIWDGHTAKSTGSGGTHKQAILTFNTVTTEEQLKELLNQAVQKKQPVLLDFYADWCLTCQTMERHLFNDKEIQALLQGFMRIRVDMTHMTTGHEQLQQAYAVIAPPTLLFFNRDGTLLQHATLVGHVDKVTLLDYLLAVSTQAE